MKVGYGRKNITPTAPFYLLGYKTPKRNQPAKGIHDPIYINGILFHNNEGQEVFLATGDLLEIEDIVAADIRREISQKYHIPFENIIIGVTHDHHSVRDFHKTWEFGRYNQEYYDFFVQCFLDVVAQCRHNLVEVNVEYGQDLILGYYSNRNHQGSQSDNIVSVTKFIHDGKAVAGIVNIAVHSTVLSGDNMELTADLAGNLSTKLKEKWGFYPLMLIGCAGDSSNHYDRQGRDFAELERVTAGLAELIAPIKTTTLSLETESINVLELSHEVINDKKAYDEDLCLRIAGMKNGTIKTVGAQPVEHLIEKCEEQLTMPQFYDILQLGILDIGNLRFFIFPGELASAGGELLRNTTDKTVLIAGYSNGFHHYFLEAKDYGLSFETIGNPVPAGTFETIIEKFSRASHLLDN